jgi:hypothetical protein
MWTVAEKSCKRYYSRTLAALPFGVDGDVSRILPADGRSAGSLYPP